VNAIAEEIERKFLVETDAWKDRATRHVSISDGIIAAAGGRKVRVRTYDRRATLTVKGARRGAARDEFEYEIPYEDALRLLEGHCGDQRTEKIRYLVPEGDLTWEVDVYGGIMAGIVIAEIEIARHSVGVSLPDWIGKEVTGNDAYRKVNLLNNRLKRQQSRA
jgi:CYTH domain-containing protein